MKIKILFKIIAASLTLLLVFPAVLASCNIPGLGITTTEAPEATDSPEESTAEETTAEDTTAEDTTAEDTTAEDTTAEDTTAEDTTAEDTTAEDTTAEDTTAAEIEVNDYSSKTYNLKDNVSNVKISGRSTVAANGIAVNWSASGIEFNADCKGKIKIRIVASRAGGKYAVFIDGVETGDLEVNSSGSKTYVIASDLEAGVHNVRLAKRSDAETVETFMSVIIEGLLAERPEDNKMFVEIIGDSITCGYGLDVTSTASSIKHDATKSWAYLLAQEVGFDYSLVSIGGIGVAASTERHEGREMGDLYPYTFYKNTSVEHSVERKADIVIIALNTNDNGRTSQFTEEEYKTRAKELISQVKAIHGEDVKIVWVSALMFNAGTCDAWAKAVLEELGGEAAGYYHVSGTPNSGGFNAHPTAVGQSSNAKVIKIHLRTKGLIAR